MMKRQVVVAMVLVRKKYFLRCSDVISIECECVCDKQVIITLGKKVQLERRAQVLVVEMKVGTQIAKEEEEEAKVIMKTIENVIPHYNIYKCYRRRL